MTVRGKTVDGRKALLAVLIIFFVISVFIIIFKRENTAPTINTGKFTKIPINSDVSAVGVVNDNIYFSNGRNLVSYNKKSGQSKALSNTLVFPEVVSVSVSPDEKYTSFSTHSNARDIEPFKTLMSYSGESSGDIIWIANNNTQEITYVSSSDSPLKWIGENKYAFSAGNNLLTGSVGSSPQVVYEGSSPIKLYDYVNGELYASEQNKQIFKFSNNKIGKIYSYGTAALFNPRQKGCFFFQNSEDESDVRISSLVGCGKADKELNSYISTAKFSNDGKYFFFNQRNDEGEIESRYIDIATGHEGEWKPGEGVNDFEIINTNGPSDFILRIGSTYLGQGIKEIKTIEDSSSFNVNGVSVDNDKDNQLFLASKYGGFSNEDKTNVINSISSKGYDVNLFSIKFDTLDGDDYRW